MLPAPAAGRLASGWGIATLGAVAVGDGMSALAAARMCAGLAMPASVRTPSQGGSHPPVVCIALLALLAGCGGTSGESEPYSHPDLVATNAYHSSREWITGPLEAALSALDRGPVMHEVSDSDSELSWAPSLAPSSYEKPLSPDCLEYRRRITSCSCARSASAKGARFHTRRPQFAPLLRLRRSNGHCYRSGRRQDSRSERATASIPVPMRKV